MLYVSLFTVNYDTYPLIIHEWSSILFWFNTFTAKYVWYIIL